MSNKRVIGLSGVARAGKDTFASILETKLVIAGKTVKKIALAAPLKKDCVDFLAKTLKIDAYTQVPEEKVLIRPMLVWYGDAQRKLTGGRYWINLADNAIKQSDYDYYIITDVRYDFYEKDEIYWLQHECNGTVAHVSRWTKKPFDENVKHMLKPEARDGFFRNFVPPANDHERENDPKVKAKADFIVEWESVEGKTEAELILDPSLNAYVDAFMAKFNIS